MRTLRHYLLCARDRRREVARVFRRGAHAPSRKISKMRETPIPQGVLQRHQLHRSVACSRCGMRRQRFGRCAEMRGKRAIACEKNFGKCARASAYLDRIRRESSESPASDSRQASLAVTFWRRRGAAAIFFRQPDHRSATQAEAGRRADAQFRRRDSAAGAPARQMSSLRLRSSLTALGLALPADAFIT